METSAVRIGKKMLSTPLLSLRKGEKGRRGKIPAELHYFVHSAVIGRPDMHLHIFPGEAEFESMRASHPSNIASARISHLSWTQSLGNPGASQKGGRDGLVLQNWRWDQTTG
jgi:hypothetical protein